MDVRENFVDYIIKTGTVFYYFDIDFILFGIIRVVIRYADFYEEFKETGCEIYSVSEDTHFVHKAWADASETIRRISYPMLADPAGKLARFFGVLVEEAGQALRGTFIVNPEGKIRAYEVHDMGIGRSAEELLRKVQAAQYVETHGDEVCPARWKPGEETLTPSLDLVGLL